MSGHLQGSILLEVRKTTKMSLSRFLKLLANQLTTRIDGPIEFQPIPDHMELYQGKVNRVIQTTVVLIVINLKLSCTRKTHEDGEKYGHIALVGNGSLGLLNLACSVTLMENFKWVTREDLAQIQWQTLCMKLPPTHIRLETMEGQFRLSYYEKMARWEDTETIDTKISRYYKGKRDTESTNGAHEGSTKTRGGQA